MAGRFVYRRSAASRPSVVGFPRAITRRQISLGQASDEEVDEVCFGVAWLVVDVVEPG